MVVDSSGLLLDAFTAPADVQDRVGGKESLRHLEGEPRLARVLVDAGFSGAPMAELGESLGFEVEVVEAEKGKGFTLQAKRWVVERTLAWLVKCRRLRVDYEASPRTTTAWMYLAMIRIMARRIANAT
ncbi:MAG: transposase [Fimbriimonas sp.]